MVTKHLILLSLFPSEKNMLRVGFDAVYVLYVIVEIFLLVLFSSFLCTGDLTIV